MAPSGSTAPTDRVRRSQAFRERARLEADRYGPDPWIFVRELLQNSRDAGATAVSFMVEDVGGQEIVRCVDDGEGMTFEHARRYLFALYASSKENSSDQAGKFGVGFWSILRFEPEQILIRSGTRDGKSWGLRLDGTLEHATQIDGLAQPGTEITVVRRGGDGRLEHRVFDAVWQSARYLHRRDDDRTPLPVTINGRSANAEFALGAPSAAFRRGSVRGVVGLGPAPRVELFSRGLRLRAAASLEDLVAPTGRHTSRMRVQFPELPGGLAPQALLESDELQVMLSRSDARDNRALNRLVKLAQRELERLIDRQLSQARPRSWWRHAWDFFADRFRESLMLRTVVGSLIGAAVAVLLGWMLWGRSPPPAPLTKTEPPAPAQLTAPRGPRPYQDLGARYRGPRVDVLEPSSAEPIELRYLPASRRLHFAALTFSELAKDGSPAIESPLNQLGPYRGLTCDRNCVDVELPVSGPSTGAAAIMRIPVPTGHRVVADSLHLGDRPIALQMTDDGHPALSIDAGVEAQLRYRTVAGPDPHPTTTPRTSSALPESLVRQARALRRKMVEDRVRVLLDEVRTRVDYDRTPRVAARHFEAMKSGSGFIDRTLEIGAGDCDVQNGLLVALLHAAHVEARLAVGYIGSEGRVFPWLHAWVEYRDESGAWHIADASEGESSALPGLGSPSPVPGPSDKPSFEIAASPRAPGSADSARSAPSAPPSGGTADQPRSTPQPPIEVAGGRSDDDDDDSLVAFISDFDDRWPWALRGAPLLLLALAGWSLIGGRTRRALKLDDTPDLSRLLQGVLQQPGAFAQMSALFTRPVVPCIEGNAISINRARELATRGQLYQTAGRPALARRAMRSKAAVLDVTTPEGRTVADSLGAIDLDRWAQWLDGARSTQLTRLVNRELRSRGEDWGISLASGLPGPMTVLDLGKLGAKLSGFRGSRLVLLDPGAPELAQAEKTAQRSPKAGTFVLLDILAERLDLDSDRRSQLLGEAARQALLESFSRP